MVCPATKVLHVSGALLGMSEAGWPLGGVPVLYTSTQTAAASATAGKMIDPKETKTTQQL